MAGPCIACKDPDGGVVAATLTARPRGSHTADCWSAGDWGEREEAVGEEEEEEGGEEGMGVRGDHRHAGINKW